MKTPQYLVSPYGSKIFRIGDDGKVEKWNNVTGEWELYVKKQEQAPPAPTS